ncbi:hypothetical protein D9M71_762280 [compost metagenome]
MRRVIIRRDDVAVARGEQLAVMTKAVEAANVLRRGRVERLFFHGLVVHEHRIGVDPRLLRDRPQIIGTGGQQPARQHQATAHYTHAAQYLAATDD